MFNLKFARDFWNRLINSDKKNSIANLFRFTLNESEKIEVFREFVEIVNLETSTLCNRSCEYCPLFISNRGKKQVKLSQQFLNKLINQLEIINYERMILLNLYNEPLLDDDLKQIIFIIRKRLPNTYISFNSNGDYITRDKLNELIQNGLNQIRITLHTNHYRDEERQKHIRKFFDKLGISTYSVDKFIPNQSIQISTQLESLNIILMCNNWKILGNNRTGSVKELVNHSYNRINPCMRPFREIVISAEGYCYPCCNFFPNSEISNSFILGKIDNESIFDIFSSRIMVDFRKKLFDFSPKFYPCNICNDLDNSDINSDVIRKSILSDASKCEKCEPINVKPE